MKKNGYILIEVLVASALLSLVGSGLYAGLSNAFKIERKIRQAGALYDPFKILWISSNKDLRNMVSLRKYPFSGKKDKMTFPVMSAPAKILRVSYFEKEGKLLRSEETLPEKFVKRTPRESVLLDNLEWVRFEYVYLDEEENPVFKPIWMEEPYFGLPRAVKIAAKAKENGKVFSRLFSIPQGRFGHVAAGSSS